MNWFLQRILLKALYIIDLQAQIKNNLFRFHHNALAASLKIGSDISISTVKAIYFLSLYAINKKYNLTAKELKKI